MSLTRRTFLASAVAGAGVAVAGRSGGRAAAAGSSELPPSGAADPGLGTLLDYAVGVPSAAAVRGAGHRGVIRYVSDRRPGAEFMTGKPLLRAEADQMRAAGLAVVSCYQFGKAETADWLGGFAAGLEHARRGDELHRQAGGPVSAPIYASIDDDPSAEQFYLRIAPYLAGWNAVVGPGRVGLYANAPTIQRAASLGLATRFWQHGWGTPAGYVHPAAHLRQLPGQSRVGGVEVDVNTILKPEFGAWT
ncbi:DUF1906 domain-containing protein [Gordonia humi]|uniref:Rv2525c-like glycoside hydrolase-like domain-containing protein n=1 Tax=Gordonia humi TaxID=686429 RepID=A0A840EU90_9ACTN|nr:DUF1906 domain-containing protein [Gordonia humi]MBB4136495.1 hypothetical protein [Gordonia humi]